MHGKSSIASATPSSSHLRATLLLVELVERPQNRRPHPPGGPVAKSGGSEHLLLFRLPHKPQQRAAGLETTLLKIAAREICKLNYRQLSLVFSRCGPANKATNNSSRSILQFDWLQGLAAFETHELFLLRVPVQLYRTVW